MKQLVKRLTINKEFVFRGGIDDLKEILKNSKDINYKAFSAREIKITPSISWGTMTMSGIRVPISVRATFTEQNPGELRIILTTKIRPEHYLLVVLFTFCILGVVFSDEPDWLTIYVFGLWIICHLWFQFIYRLQENHLINKLVARLGLSSL
jgi:hypothetical protein